MTEKRVLQTSKPQIGEPERLAIERVLESGYFGMGPEVRLFEQELEVYLGGERTVTCVNAGTSALHLAVEALELQPEHEVLVPSLTYLSSFQAVAMAGVRPVACDVRIETGLLDLADARRRLSARTQAIMFVHYAGNPGDLDELYEFAQANGLRVIEDAAHAFGSRYNGRLVGSVGDIVCFSFDPIKNITSGQGGAIVTKNEAVIERVRHMRNLGLRYFSDTSGKPDFDVRSMGWRYEMSDLMAAIGRAQLARFEKELKPARMALAAAYGSRLGGIDGITLIETGPEVVPHIVPIRVDSRERAAVQAELMAAGYETKVHYKPNHMLSAFNDGSPRPVCERLHAELLTLPSHAGVTETHIEDIAGVLERHLAPGLRSPR